MKKLLIETYGSRLNQSLIELFQELDLPQNLIQDVKRELL